LPRATARPKACYRPELGMFVDESTSGWAWAWRFSGGRTTR
jgi:hypothetical protein